jgi:hypothetical protein
VPAGATSATFAVTTTSVTTTTLVTVTATAGSVSRTADLTVNGGAGGGGGGGESLFRSPTRNQADTGGDGNGFQTSPLNAHAEDGAVATDTNSGSGTSTSCTNSRKDTHRFFDFGFTVPDGSAVNGIEVRMRARADSTSGAPRMCVQLSWDGGTTWTAAKQTGTLSTTLSNLTLGGAADTWGRTWTAAQLSNASFRLRVINVSSSTSRDFFLDAVAVRVHTGTPAPASLAGVSVNPTPVVGGNPSAGTVTLTAPAPAGGAAVSLSSTNAEAASVPASVTVAAGATSATFSIATSPVGDNTAVTISGAYSGASRSAILMVTPVPPPASLISLNVNPASVTGGVASQGTVALTSAAPAGGAAVSLSSSNGAVAGVPQTVTIAAGAISATFAASTSSVATATPVTITAVYGGVTRTTTLTVNPAAQGATLIVSASGRSGERITSSPAGINVAVGSSGSASFATGTSITLTVSNGRDAIWSGACSSSGSKRRSCTFTLNGNASVSANVQ